MGQFLIFTRNFKKVLAFGLLLAGISWQAGYALPGNAGWSDSDQAWLRTYDNPFPDHFASTVWGAVQAEPLSLGGIAGSRKILVQTPRFDKAPLPVIFRILKDSRGLTQKAPLIVYLPGLFSDLESGQSLRGANMYKNLGYHVAVIPSPWSKEYIDAKRSAWPGDIENEALDILSVIQALKELLNQEGALTQVHLSGSSYGGFLSSVILAKDAEGEKIITGSTTIFGAPKSLGVGMEHLDRLLETYYSEAINTPDAQIGALGVNFLRARTQSHLLPVALRKAGMMMSYAGFNRGLASAMYYLDDERALHRIPRLGGRDYSQWAKKQRFQNYLELNPEMGAIFTDGRDSLLYWLHKAESAGAEQYRVIVADDDFLNNRADWSTLNPRHYAVLATGGHLGFMALDWFEMLIQRIF
jgi:predicted dienelactone hydrolase